MANQDKDSSFKLNIGGPSIILLLTVLGLALFAVLSVRAAYNGLKLARTSEASAEEYYAAAGKVEEVRFRIAEAVAGGADSSALCAIDGVTEAGDEEIICIVAVNDISHIELRLAGIGTDIPLAVLEHRLKVISDDEYDGQTFEIMDPLEFGM